MGANVLKAANCIKETAAQMRSYLKGTAGEGLRYKEKIEDPITLYVHSGSSFAPESNESHGSFVVVVRQGTITLSTAESELMGLVEAMVAGESVLWCWLNCSAMSIRWHCAILRLLWPFWSLKEEA